ncbi:MAG: RtcB family protein [Phycisphaerae bacterium]
MTTISHELLSTGEATAILPVDGGQKRPVTVIGTDAIRETIHESARRQAVNVGRAPGVDHVVLNPDAHPGYGAPIGCVMTSRSHIYPGPVGVDIKCSMSLLQLDLPAGEIEDRKLRRALIDAICERTPTGAGKGQRSVPKSRPVNQALGRRVAVEGASAAVCDALGIPVRWANRCEDAFHLGHDDSRDALSARLDWLMHRGGLPKFADQMTQLGSYGGGNHFGECEVVDVADEGRAAFCAKVFGLKHNHVAFLSHCGSRGFGHTLATAQFAALQQKFDTWGIEFPAQDRHLCFAPLGTPEADAYLDDMALGANFATVNHMLINALVLEAFQEVIPGVEGELVYFISHNIARKEIVDEKPAWVMRKGATRAFPAGHHALKDTPFAASGHPILLPGDPQRGSAVMVADKGADISCFSVNHGAGRVLSRKHAERTLDQKGIDQSFDDADILTNCRHYPKDESPAAYKDFDDVLDSVKLAGLASEVARLRAKFVIKDSSEADD